jgi:hypothetical protein
MRVFRPLIFVGARARRRARSPTAGASFDTSLLRLRRAGRTGRPPLCCRSPPPCEAIWWSGASRGRPRSACARRAAGMAAPSRPRPRRVSSKLVTVLRVGCRARADERVYALRFFKLGFTSETRHCRVVGASGSRHKARARLYCEPEPTRRALPRRWQPGSQEASGL